MRHLLHQTHQLERLVYNPVDLLTMFVYLYSTAVDFTHESLRLLEEEPKTPENADKLKDDKAQALLWLYICTLEKNLQEVSTAQFSCFS